MSTRVERFHSAVARFFGGQPGRGSRYREDLRQEAIALAREGMSGGKSLRRVAEELGISPATLTRWLERGGAGEPLRPVEVLARCEAEPEHGPVSSLVVVTPSGWRIEGLGLKDVMALLAGLE